MRKSMSFSNSRPWYLEGATETPYLGVQGPGPHSSMQSSLNDQGGPNVSCRQWPRLKAKAERARAGA